MTKPPTASEAIAASVRKYRQLRGWSVRELAEKCSELGATTLTQASLTNIERGLTAKEGRGSRTVTVDELLVLSMALGVPAAALMFPFGEHSEIAVSPMFAWPVLDAFRWFVGGEAARGLIPAEIRWVPEPPLFKSSTRAMMRVAEIEDLRTAAEAVRDWLHGDPEKMLAARRQLEVMWQNAKPARRAQLEHAADRNNRPRPGLPISDEEYIRQWREALPATYESRLRMYARELWRAVDSGDLRVPPPVPAALYDDLMALPAEEHLEGLAPEEPMGDVPIPARPILPPGIEVARPKPEAANGDS